MKVLEINDGLHPPLAPHQFPGADVDVYSIYEWERDDTRYDAILCYHALQLVEFDKVPGALRDMALSLVDGGELWMMTPSLEWVATQAITNKPHPLLNLYLFGDRVHARSAFTLLWLRIEMEKAGMITRRATQGEYKIKVGEQVIDMIQNVVIGMRYDAALDASKALE
jgi:hypothetical protein